MVKTVIKEFEDLKAFISAVREKNDITTEIELDEVDDTHIEIGFPYNDTFINVQLDTEDSENPYFCTAEDPDIPTAHETFCEDFQKCKDQVDTFITMFAK